MGRIRSIKPEILTDAKACRLSDAAWRLWVSTWVLADDLGRCPADPWILGGQVFPQRALTEVSGALSELSSSGLVRCYEVNGDAYLEISGFTRHQKINRPSGPKFPAPSGGFTEPSVSPHGALYADRDRDHDRDHDREGDHDLSQPARAGRRTPRPPDWALEVSQGFVELVAKAWPSEPAVRKPTAVESWAGDLDLLVRRDGVSRDELAAGLAWYAENAGQDFVPEIRSGKALRKKWGALQAAIKRSERPIRVVRAEEDVRAAWERAADNERLWRSQRLSGGGD